MDLREYDIEVFEKAQSEGQASEPRKSSKTTKNKVRHKYKFIPPDIIAPIADIGQTLDSYDLPPNITEICLHGHDPDNPVREGDNSRSGWMFSTVCKLVMYGVPDDIIYGIITDKKYKISASVLDKPNSIKYAVKEIEKAHEFIAATSPMFLHEEAPLVSAKEYLWRYHPHLMHYNADWLNYSGAAYAEIEDNTIKSELYSFLDKQLTMTKHGPLPFNPTKNKIVKVMDALEGITHYPRDIYAPPCWREGEGPAAQEIVVCRNGLLHLPSSQLHPLTPRFFTRNALDFDYDQNAKKPEKWLRFLNEIWPDDKESIDTLQEIFGYMLIPDTSQQKIFIFVGPKRSGKGTIAKILTRLVGQKNACAPTVKSLDNPFGLQPLIGKQIAIISDMRIGKKTDQAALAENLLRISGEDDVTVDRKYKTAWHGRLAVRFLIMTNEIPRLSDASGALASRFIPLIMTESFFGKENPGLANELTEELPAILNWAVEGWQRLHSRGYFVMPQSAQSALQELSDLAAPVAAFIREECELGPGMAAPKVELYNAYKMWNERQGHYYTSDMAVFGRDLLSALQGKIKPTKIRVNGQRMPAYMGIRIRKEPEQEEIPF